MRWCARDSSARAGRDVLMKNHGIILGAGSLRRATDLIDIIERTAEIIIGCHAFGQSHGRFRTNW
jgi:ribulose-5-phosphate 4-epimerase/fuculose-1-phosphate aldolase